MARSLDSLIDLLCFVSDNHSQPMLVYLSGSIEYAPDKGTTWRASFTPFLRSLGHDVYDPASDVKKNLTDEEVRDFRKWKTTDLQRFQGTIRKIIAWDLDYVEHKCDYIVAYWDEGAQRGAGTGAEVTMAHRRGIPVYMVAGVPIGQISGWILGCVTRVFADFEQLKHFLAQQFSVPHVLPSQLPRDNVGNSSDGKRTRN